MSRKRSRFAGYAPQQIAIRADGVDIEIENLKTRLVEIFRQPFAGNSHSHAVAGALAQRPGGGFHSTRQVRLGMSGSPAVDLPKALDLLHRNSELIRNFSAGVDAPHSPETPRGIHHHPTLSIRTDKTFTT